jgi:hypothetical protein
MFDRSWGSEYNETIMVSCEEVHMREYQIAFWNPGFQPDGGDVFGCATLGYVDGETWAEPTEQKTALWRRVRGEAFSGSYADMLRACRESACRPSAILAFFTYGEGNDDFTDALQALYPEVPILGGTAARTDSQEKGEVLPRGEDGAVLLICGGAYTADCLRVHRHELGTPQCQVENRRDICRVGGVPAAEYLAGVRAQLGKPEADFESLTFHEPCGKNVHCCVGENGAVHAGADVVQTPLYLAEIDRAEATDAIADYMNRTNTLSIGCAGLKSLVTRPFAGSDGNVGVFLFGEVVPFPDGRSRFANLMLGRLTQA